MPSSCQHLPLPGCSASRLGGLGASSANEPCKSVSGGIQGSAKISWHFFYPSGPAIQRALHRAWQPNPTRASWQSSTPTAAVLLGTRIISSPLFSLSLGTFQPNQSQPSPSPCARNKLRLSAAHQRGPSRFTHAHSAAHKLTNPSAQRTQPAPFLSLSAPDFLAPQAKQPSSPPATTRESHRAYRQPGHRLASNLGTHRTRRVAFRKAVNFHGRQERLHDKTLARAERSRKRVERV